MSALLAVLFFATSCSSQQTLVEAPATLKSVVEMKDQSAVAQLTHGFWKLEAGSWRWTAKKFRAVLEAPPGAAQRGAMLELHFNLRKEVIAGGDPLELVATINGMRLPRVAFADPGPQLFWRVVPPEALQTRPIVVEISADHALPKETDDRELSLVVNKIGLLPR